MNPPSDFKGLVDVFLGLARMALPVLVGLALLVFIWGLVKFIYRVGGDEKAVNDGKNLMIWGLIGLFVLVSFMGIISFFYKDIGFTRSFGIPFLPPR